MISVPGNSFRSSSMQPASISQKATGSTPSSLKARPKALIPAKKSNNLYFLRACARVLVMGPSDAEGPGGVPVGPGGGPLGPPGSSAGAGGWLPAKRTCFLRLLKRVLWGRFSTGCRC